MNDACSGIITDHRHLSLSPTRTQPRAETNKRGRATELFAQLAMIASIIYGHGCLAYGSLLI